MTFAGQDSVVLQNVEYPETLPRRDPGLVAYSLEPSPGGEWHTSN